MARQVNRRRVAYGQSRSRNRPNSSAGRDDRNELPRTPGGVAAAHHLWVSLRSGWLRHLLGVPRADFCCHAKADHGCTGQSSPRPETGLPESHRSFQYVFEDLVSRGDLRGVAVCAVPGMGVYRTSAVSQRAPLCAAIHVQHGRVCSWQAAISATGWFTQRRWTSLSPSAASSRP